MRKLVLLIVLIIVAAFGCAPQKEAPEKESIPTTAEGVPEIAEGLQDFNTLDQELSGDEIDGLEEDLALIEEI